MERQAGIGLKRRADAAGKRHFGHCPKQAAVRAIMDRRDLAAEAEFADEVAVAALGGQIDMRRRARPEEHTPELPSLLRNSYGVFSVNKQTFRTPPEAPTTQNK